MTTYVKQDCGCIINVYSDGSAGGAEIGEWCDLHAAAPDLLAACEAALIWIHGRYMDNAGKEIYDRVRNAIPKAKGEQS